MNMTVIHQNVTEPQAIENKKKTDTCVRRNCESGLAIHACCTQAGPAHAAGRGDGMDR